MTADQGTGLERRSPSQNRLTGLVASRNETLALYAELARLRPFTDEPFTAEALQQFCEALIDYTASAHFQLYRYVAERRERRVAVRDVAERIYPRISVITESTLAFNDRYAVADLNECLPTLVDDLSRLGEELADRIQLEDQLIDALIG
ncbi:MAG TPA: Rsd/AlgQ family anti-sigma factor [Gammaproteobacteria bacterium]|nr:Rsd/AlgQ family anti-sigma factor [Gammaproteobacteria bacterium]